MQQNNRRNHCRNREEGIKMNGSPDVIVAVAFLFFMTYVAVAIYLRRRKLRKEREEAKEVIVLSPFECGQTLEDVCRGCNKCQNVKIPRKHFPPRTAHEKRLWKKDKKPED